MKILLVDSGVVVKEIPDGDRRPSYFLSLPARNLKFSDVFDDASIS